MGHAVRAQVLHIADLDSGTRDLVAVGMAHDLPRAVRLKAHEIGGGEVGIADNTDTGVT